MYIGIHCNQCILILGTVSNRLLLYLLYLSSLISSPSLVLLLSVSLFLLVNIPFLKLSFDGCLVLPLAYYLVKLCIGIRSRFCEHPALIVISNILTYHNLII